MQFSQLIGKNIRLALQTKNMTEGEFAKALHIPLSDARRICEGRTLLTPALLQEITSLLSISSRDLLAKDTNPSYPMSEAPSPNLVTF